MKKLILSVFMFALIAGVGVTTSASAPDVESPNIVATPNIAYCLWGSSIALNSGYVFGGAGFGVAGGWAVAAGYGLAATLGIASGVGAAFLAAGV